MAGSPASPPPTLRARAARTGTSRHAVNRALPGRGAIRRSRRGSRHQFLGSWTFIAIQTVIVAIWVTGNVILLFKFDPFPFILLNLAFSTQAAYAAPLILLAGNRQALRDRMTLEHAAAEADIEEEQNKELLKGTKELVAEQSRDPRADRGARAAHPPAQTSILDRLGSLGPSGR